MTFRDPSDQFERSEGIEPLTPVFSRFRIFLSLRDFPYRFQEVSLWSPVGIDKEDRLPLREVVGSISHQLLCKICVIDPGSETDPVILSEILAGGSSYIDQFCIRVKICNGFQKFLCIAMML